ncbi:MAG: glycoside hydrolase family 6 protein [Candidatus Dormibacteraeota bacterium]|nr:glycoside hydrolase family 6 protein [Candidatus Dormibacteraeota bacterium]
MAVLLASGLIAIGLSLRSGAQGARGGPTTAAGGGAHVDNPYVGADGYLNPDYVARVRSQAAADGNSSAEARVAGYQTAIWMDHIGAITGDAGHRGLRRQLEAAVSRQGGRPELVEVVIYDLPGRDCAAGASNGELPATRAGLSEYESRFIDPIASVLGNGRYRPLRIVTLIEPDSLPNAVTNRGLPPCAAAAPLYEQGIEYALDRLHAIPNVYTYLDVGQSAWLGWPNNSRAAGEEYARVARATRSGLASVDGFVSNTSNYVPTQEPLLTNPTQAVGGRPLDSATFYQDNPTLDEYSYDQQLYRTLVSNGFPSRIQFLIDTSRNGWGGADRPAHLDSGPATPDAYAAANRIDRRPFRGDWCNQATAGIGARPQAEPFGSSTHIGAFVWVKPPGESDGDYPTESHPHGDTACDPRGRNGGQPTGSLPGADVPAGQWFPAEFQTLVRNAYPALS